MPPLTRLLAPRPLNLLAFLACMLAMATALFLQYIMKLEPCPLCIFQRVAVIVAGLIFLIAALHNPQTWGRRLYGLLTAALVIIGGAISIRHLWIQAHPDAIFSCGPSDLGYIFGNNSLHDAVALVLRGTADCAETHGHFLGLTIPGWTLILFIGLLTVALFQLFRPSNNSDMTCRSARAASQPHD